jgi:wobble nucleotide-excising tRNase
LATIKDKLDTDTIIYIDDPISSLDNNHIFFMFSLIDTEITKTKNFQQLFISTHNLDFLKYLKRLSVSKPEKNLQHFLIESTKKLHDRRSFIKEMPHHLKVYVTEFNYLFNELYSYYLQIESGGLKPEESYNQFYNLPNNMRKFLEYYLFYKFPNNDNPLKNLGKLFDDEVPSLLNRVINELSHLTHIDRGWNPIDVSEAEECVKIIIEKIQEKDIDQFNALLESIGESQHV